MRPKPTGTYSPVSELLSVEGASPGEGLLRRGWRRESWGAPSPLPPGEPRTPSWGATPAKGSAPRN